jgi:hypothetical protein
LTLPGGEGVNTWKQRGKCPMCILSALVDRSFLSLIDGGVLRLLRKLSGMFPVGKRGKTT